MASKKKVAKELKEMVFLIEYRVAPEDAGEISEIMDKMREIGAAEIVDIKVEKRSGD
jgi:hypothetical protein